MAWIGRHAQRSGSCHDYGDGVQRLASYELAGAHPREQRVLPKRKRVGSMGTVQNGLPPSITLTEVDEMQNQGLIPQA